MGDKKGMFLEVIDVWLLALLLVFRWYSVIIMELESVDNFSGIWGIFGIAILVCVFLEYGIVDLKKVYHSALQSYGIGLMIPFGTVGRLELNYSLSQKRFSFLFCAMYCVCYKQ